LRKRMRQSFDHRARRSAVRRTVERLAARLLPAAALACAAGPEDVPALIAPWT